MVDFIHTKIALIGEAGVIGGILSELFGGWDVKMATLLIFIAVDYITGLVIRVVFPINDKIDSLTCWQGLLRKGMTLVIVLVSTRLDMIMGTMFIRDAVLIAYIVIETMNIIENAGRMGLPIPNMIMQAIEQLQGKGGEKK